MDPEHPTHTEPSPDRPTPARRRGLFLLLAGIAVVTYGLDQLSKWWAVSALPDEPPRNLLGTFLRLDLIRNPGAAFSIGTGNTWVLTIIAVVVLVIVIRVSRRLGSSGWAWALGLLLGGALGNLTDRLVREPGLGRGHVVDFLNYNGWFIGNVADIAIVTAAILIGLLAITGRGVDGTRETREPRGTGRHEATGHDVA
jgi:signal peptidase II